MSAIYKPSLVHAYANSSLFDLNGDSPALRTVESYVHTSPVTTPHLTRCNAPLEILKKLLSLPKALVGFSYWKGWANDDTGVNAYSIWDVGQLLSQYQSKSPEVLTLIGVEADLKGLSPRQAPSCSWVA